MFPAVHKTVLLEASLEMLHPESGGIFVDATLGLGGHSEAILASSPDTTVIGIDLDLEAISSARMRLKVYGDRFSWVQGNYADVRQLTGLSNGEAAGIIADLGVSSLQFDSATRGFSFRFDAPLDMRMDANSDTETAAELLMTRSEEEIANIIYEFGEERRSRAIARRIVRVRESGKPVTSTRELAALVERAIGRGRTDRIHPATKTFQALRVAVNDELSGIDIFLSESVKLLKTDGRLVVITFHSLEDRIVKQAFQRFAGKCICPPKIPKCACGAVKIAEILTKKPLTATEAEVNENPRARSAKLRAVRKLELTPAHQ